MRKIELGIVMATAIAAKDQAVYTQKPQIELHSVIWPLVWQKKVSWKNMTMSFFRYFKEISHKGPIMKFLKWRKREETVAAVILSLFH